MADSLDYILRNIEHHCLVEGGTLPGMEENCLQSEELPCNCITGIVVNYAAYVAKNCFPASHYTAKIQVADGCYYVACQEESSEKSVCPVLRPPNPGAADVGSVVHLCGDSKASQAYIRLSSGDQLDSLRQKLQKIIRSSPRKTFPYSKYQVTIKFWIDFLSMVRVQPLDIASKALLFMSIYMFPEQTFPLICNSEYVFVPDLIHSYLAFFLQIGGSNRIGFLHRFASAFQAETGLAEAGFDISKFVEGMSKLPSPSLSASGNIHEDLFLNALISNYAKNDREISFETGSLRKFCLESGSPILKSMLDKFPPVRDCDETITGRI